MVCPSDYAYTIFRSSRDEAKDLSDEITKHLRTFGKERKLKSWEVPQKVILLHEIWTSDNQALTGTGKKNRTVLLRKHASALRSLYEGDFKQIETLDPELTSLLLSILGNHSPIEVFDIQNFTLQIVFAQD